GQAARAKLNQLVEVARLAEATFAGRTRFAPRPSSERIRTARRLRRAFENRSRLRDTAAEFGETRHARSRWPRGDGSRGYFGAARRRARRHRDSQAVRDRLARAVRLMPPVSGPGRRREWLSHLVHHAGGAGDEGATR